MSGRTHKDSNADGSSTRATSEAGLHPDDELDRLIVEGQLGRPPRAMEAVAVRCVYGLPAVTRQAPTGSDGNPFPTRFYLTCPHLVKQVDRIESGGGVRRYEELLAADPELKDATDAAHERHRAISGRDWDIAGSGERSRLKCLHAHAAFALAESEHPLGARVLREAGTRWCATASCVSIAMSAGGRWDEREPSRGDEREPSPREPRA